MRWTVIRVPAEQGQETQAALIDAFAPVTMSIDTTPPAAGPEWEISIQDQREDAVRAALNRVGVLLLAIKTEVRPPMSEHPWERHGDYSG